MCCSELLPCGSPFNQYERNREFQNREYFSRGDSGCDDFFPNMIFLGLPTAKSANMLWANQAQFIVLDHGNDQPA